VAEGRIPPEAGLLAESAGVWRPASEVYGQLRRSGLLTAASNPFADLPTAPSFQGQTAVAFRRPHRGVLILAFGILAWLICPIFGPIAWAMGHADLREMRSGVMDPGGMSLTQAGMILGMVATILVVLGLSLMCLGGLA
jgi:hypothetical protein